MIRPRIPRTKFGQTVPIVYHDNVKKPVPPHVQALLLQCLSPNADAMELDTTIPPDAIDTNTNCTDAMDATTTTLPDAMGGVAIATHEDAMDVATTTVTDAMGGVAIATHEDAMDVATTTVTDAMGGVAIATHEDAVDVAPVHTQPPHPVVRCAVTNLNAAVIPAHLDTERRCLAETILNDDWVRSNTMGPWMAALFPRNRNAQQQWTHIDVAVDPIVPVLRDWVTRCLDDVAARGHPPAYPAANDPRPPERVLDGFGALPNGGDVYPNITASLLPGTLAAYEKYYAKGGISSYSEAVCDERLRQWRRLTKDGRVTDLPFKQIVRALGYCEIENDYQVIHAITHALMQHRHPSISHNRWYDRQGRTINWTWPLCLPSMRDAIVYVHRLRIGKANLQWLETTVHGGMPSPPAPTHIVMADQ